MNKKKLKEIRNKIDKLDQQLIKIIKKRTLLVNQVIKAKSNKNQIIDKKRIKFVLSNIRKASIKRKIDTKLTNKIWKSMIYAYIDYEKRKFKK